MRSLAGLLQKCRQGIDAGQQLVTIQIHPECQLARTFGGYVKKKRAVVEVIANISMERFGMLHPPHICWVSRPNRAEHMPFRTDVCRNVRSEPCNDDGACTMGLGEPLTLGMQLSSWQARRRLERRDPDYP